MCASYPALTEHKLLLLYCFDSLGPMTNQQALRFVVEAALMDYIDVQLSLAELTESGLMVVLGDEAVRAYHLTSRGKQTLSYFETRIPSVKRAAVDLQAPDWRSRFRLERQVSAEYEKGINPNEYVVKLCARENEQVLLEAQISVVSREQAQTICEAFRTRSSEVYGALMNLLLYGRTLAPVEPSASITEKGSDDDDF